MCYQCEQGVPHYCPEAGAVVGNPSKGYLADDARGSLRSMQKNERQEILGFETSSRTARRDGMGPMPADHQAAPKNTRGGMISLEPHLPTHMQPHLTDSSYK